MISVAIREKIQEKMPDIRKSAILGNFPAGLSEVVGELGLESEPRLRLLLVFIGECFLYSPQCINDNMVVERAYEETKNRFCIDSFTMELVREMDDNAFAYMLLDILKERDVANEFGRALAIDRELQLGNTYVYNYLDCVSHDFRLIGRLEVSFLNGDLGCFYRLLNYHIHRFWSLNLIAYEEEISRRLNGLTNDKINSSSRPSGSDSIPPTR
jgi:hypothetical protein